MLTFFGADVDVDMVSVLLKKDFSLGRKDLMHLVKLVNRLSHFRRCLSTVSRSS